MVDGTDRVQRLAADIDAAGHALAALAAYLAETVTEVQYVLSSANYDAEKLDAIQQLIDGALRRLHQAR